MKESYEPMVEVNVNTALGEQKFTINDLEAYYTKAPGWDARISQEGWDIILEMGLNKGLPFELTEGEVISVPENALFVTRYFRYKTQKHYLLKVMAWSDKQGWVEFPVSIMRRIPALPKHIAEVSNSNEFWTPMLTSLPNDVDRARFIAGKTFKVKYAVQRPRIDFQIVDGAAVRISDEIIEKAYEAGKAKLSWFYHFSFINETTPKHKSSSKKK